MTKKFKITVSAVLIAVMFACLALFAVGCSNGNSGGNGDEDNIKTTYLPEANAYGMGQGGVVCSVAGFESAKDDWYDIKPNNILSEKAKNAVVTDLVVGETYYYVYTINLSYSDLKSLSSDYNYNFSVSFQLQGVESYTFNGGAVDGRAFVGYDTAGTANSVQIRVSPQIGSDVTLKVTGKMDAGVKTYAVMSFVPKNEGELAISCTYGNKSSSFYCTVVSKETAESGAKVQVGAINTYYEKVSDCPDGKLPENYKGGSLSSLRFAVGQSYYEFIRLELTPNESVSSAKVYCRVTATGTSVRFNVDSSDTGDYKKVGGSDVFGFSVSNGEKGKKVVTICYEVVPLNEGTTSVHVSLIGDGVLLQGNTRTDMTFTVYVNTGSDDVTQGNGVLQYSSVSGGYHVTGVLNAAAKDITVPDTYNGLPVIGISNSAFKDNQVIRNVTLGNAVSVIGPNAFYGCSNLEAVSFGDSSSLQSIGESAFEKCGKLSNLQLPVLLKTIGKNAFKACYGITAITLPAQLETIRQGAFAETGLVSVRIPASVKEIEGGAFYNCLTTLSTKWGEMRYPSLKEITVSASNNYYTSVDGVLFNKDKTILLQYPAAKEGGSYYVPETVKEIAPYAFYVVYMTNQSGFQLGTIYVPDSVDKIGERAFFLRITNTELDKLSVYHYRAVNISGDTDWICSHPTKASATITASQSKNSADLLSGDYYDYTWTRKKNG